MFHTLSVLGQTDDEVISFLIYCKREKKQKLTPEQTRYVTEASSYIAIDIHPLEQHRKKVSETLASLTTANKLESNSGHTLYVKDNELPDVLRWLQKAFPFPAVIGNGECNPLNTPVNALVSYGRANNVLKRVFGASNAAIVAENPVMRGFGGAAEPLLARSKTLDLSELQPVHRRVAELRAEHASGDEEAPSTPPPLRRATSVDSKIPSKFRNFGRKK